MNLCINRLNCCGNINIDTNFDDKEIRVGNRGVYVAQFVLHYYYKDKTYMKTSSKLTTGKIQVMRVPKDSVQFTLTAYYYYTPKHTKAFCRKTFDTAQDKCFLLVGTTLNPSCYEVPCPIGSNSGQNCCCCCHCM